MRIERYAVKSLLLICSLAAGGIWSQVARGDGAASASFPRLMGMNIGAKNYQDADYQKDLARMDVVFSASIGDGSPPGTPRLQPLRYRRSSRRSRRGTPGFSSGSTRSSA